MCKDGWCVKIRERRGCVMVGGTVLNTLKGGETKILKWGQAESRGGCLKKEGGPLANYV